MLPLDVAVVGSYVQDHAWLTEVFPCDGETRLATGFNTGPGGKGFNQAVACHRQGVKTCFIGAIGRDALGENAQRFAHDDKLPVQFDVRDDAPTAASSILVNARGENRIVVNIPEYKMRVLHGDKLVHEARVIVGKPESATPIFSHKMDHVVVNPSWFVPPSILRKEFLPGLANDPSYAARRGYVVTRGKNGSISVRQPPGERNALGWIKFMFPNDHAVYLHDTPNRRLFGADKRAFSHGCVRVENPFALADEVLGPEWTNERLKRLIGLLTTESVG